MRIFTKLTVAATLALSAMSVASSANAVVFASWYNNGDEKIVWNRSDASGQFLNGRLYTSNNPWVINTSTATPISAQFSFMNYAPLAGINNLASNFFLTATETGTPVNVNGTTLTQNNITGSFSFTYTGPTFTSVNNVLVQTGANLLSGTFSQAFITGQAGGNLATFQAQQPGQTVTFNSDFLGFANSFGRTMLFDMTYNSTKPLVLGCTPPTTNPNCVVNSRRALADFRGIGNGVFAAGAIPEPATWGLMILGFAGAGVMLRSNRRRMATVAA
jgi:PEP-CTERM motif